MCDNCKWIRLSERRPTEADADNEGHVVWIGEGFESFVSLYTRTFLQPAGVHWLPLPKFQEQDKDEEAFTTWALQTLDNTGTNQLKRAWDAALRYERGEK